MCILQTVICQLKLGLMQIELLLFFFPSFNSFCVAGIIAKSYTCHCRVIRLIRFVLTIRLILCTQTVNDLSSVYAIFFLFAQSTEFADITIGPRYFDCRIRMINLVFSSQF